MATKRENPCHYIGMNDISTNWINQSFAILIIDYSLRCVGIYHSIPLLCKVNGIHRTKVEIAAGCKFTWYSGNVWSQFPVDMYCWTSLSFMWLYACQLLAWSKALPDSDCRASCVMEDLDFPCDNYWELLFRLHIVSTTMVIFLRPQISVFCCRWSDLIRYMLSELSNNVRRSMKSVSRNRDLCVDKFMRYLYTLSRQGRYTYIPYTYIQ